MTVEGDCNYILKVSEFLLFHSLPVFSKITKCQKLSLIVRSVLFHKIIRLKISRSLFTMYHKFQLQILPVPHMSRYRKVHSNQGSNTIDSGQSIDHCTTSSFQDAAVAWIEIKVQRLSNQRVNPLTLSTFSLASLTLNATKQEVIIQILFK